MRRFAALVFSLALLFSLLITGLTAIDRLAPPTAAAIIDVNGLQESPPCWYGVCPGQINLHNAELILMKHAPPVIVNIDRTGPASDGSSMTCGMVLSDTTWRVCLFQGNYVHPDSKFVTPIAFSTTANTLLLGDVISVLGAPQTVYVCPDSSGGTAALLVFKGNIQVDAYDSTSNLEFDPQYFSPRMNVYSITYSIDKWLTYTLDDSDLLRWSGFTLKGQMNYGCKIP